MIKKKEEKKASDFALVTKLYPKSHDRKGEGTVGWIGRLGLVYIHYYV